MKPNWQTKKLKEVAEVLTGTTPSKKDKSNYDVEGYPFVKPTQLQNSIVTESSEYLSKKGWNIARKVTKGAILVTCIGELGRVGYTDNPTAFNQQINSVTFKEQVNSKYGFYFLQSPQARNYYENKASATTVSILNKSKFSDLEIPYPDLSTQKLISQKLDSLFAKIDAGEEKLKKVEEQLEVYRQAVLKKAFEGRFLKLGKWKETKIGSEYKVYVGATPSRQRKDFWNGEINWVSSGEVQFCNINKTKETITQLAYDNSSTDIHPIGTVLLGMIGQGKTRGQSAILKIPAATNQNIASIRVSETNNIPEFLYYFFQYKYLETRMLGAGNNQKALNKSRVMDININLPSPKEQKEIVKIIKHQFSLLKNFRIYIKNTFTHSKDLKQSILKKAFEGRLV